MNAAIRRNGAVLLPHGVEHDGVHENDARRKQKNCQPPSRRHRKGRYGTHQRLRKQLILPLLRKHSAADGQGCHAHKRRHRPADNPHRHFKCAGIRAIRPYETRQQKVKGHDCGKKRPQGLATPKPSPCDLERRLHLFPFQRLRRSSKYSSSAWRLSLAFATISATVPPPTLRPSDITAT